jgi:hypothetical protein
VVPAVLGAVAALTAVAVVGSGLLGLGAGGRADVPSLPRDLSVVPLGAPAPPPPGDGGYAVLATQPGTDEAVGWDPCRPLTYAVNPATAPPGSEYLLLEALAVIQAATGLVVVDAGDTDETPDEQRPALLTERYGDRWAPVLVAWSDPAASPRLAGDVAGYAGPVTVQGDEPGTLRYVSGQVVLDGPQLAEMAAGPAGLARARAVLIHELAHLVGLDHVDDPAQLMYPAATPLVVDLAEGDLRGLAAVSGRPCRTDF